MKTLQKFLIIFTVVSVICGLCAYAAEYSKFSAKFIKKFKDCDRYQETVTSEFSGKEFTTTRNIVGWMNGMCRYQETFSSDNEKYRLNCELTGLQVDDLYNAMKSKSRTPEKYELDLYALQTDPKTGKQKFVVNSSTTIIGNKAYIAWAKVQNNPYFCTPEKLSK